MNAFLTDPSLDPLWLAVASALDRNGLRWRGRLALPELTPEGRRRLGVLTERTVLPGRRSIALADLADGVERITGTDLPDVLRALGHGPTGRRDAVRARQAATQDRRDALDAAVMELLPAAGWLPAWAESAWRDGLLARLAADDVHDLVRRVAQIVQLTGRSRTEIAAHVLGDAHALDTSTPLANLVTRALVERDGAGPERLVWERAGMPLDLVSAPVLTWGLPLVGSSPVAAAARAMTAASLPLHLSVAALRHEPLRVPEGISVLVVENPRLVESAAQRGIPAAVLCTNGNATTAPTEAIAALLSGGARLRYHGDFDTAGLGMAGRALEMGCTPFHMSASDYLAAVEEAGRKALALPRDRGPVPATPWDTELAVAFSTHQLVVHEERVMDEVLRAHSSTT